MKSARYGRPRRVLKTIWRMTSGWSSPSGATPNLFPRKAEFTLDLFKGLLGGLVSARIDVGKPATDGFVHSRTIPAIRPFHEQFVEREIEFALVQPSGSVLVETFQFFTCGGHAEFLSNKERVQFTTHLTDAATPAASNSARVRPMIPGSDVRPFFAAMYRASAAVSTRNEGLNAD
jgi:hypothetical protein